MFWRLLALLIVLAGAVWYLNLLPAGQLPQSIRAHLPESVQPPVKLYRWLDAKGRPVYGTQPPAGVKAALIEGQLSTVPATQIPEPPKKELATGVTIQQLATERAVEQATEGK